MPHTGHFAPLPAVVPDRRGARPTRRSSREPHHADVAAGRLPARVPVMMTARSAVDPDGAQAGHAVLELVAVAPREHHTWGLRAGGPVAGERYSTNPDYLAAKQQMRRTSASGGSALGLALTVDQVGSRRPDVTSPLPGLFLTGAGTRHLPGVLNTLHGGAATAGAVLGRDLLAEVAAGRTYAREGGGGRARVATLADGRQDH
ncbi:hypothetical protein [Nocardioides daphniae]|uniref:Uncharacterized protein n=1 Tax=Nocardioides daphniae TaxID=402297 RepID=A0A4P7UDX6_9ACTN|nr:hypothetical protein [Nocardioides daphniae]QCC78316.1 hypothetical protein E2C04_15970 [Nocardioides daphniae]GGD13626.1 hypothetical protein GCM10007231_10850 [Nocardioides daphniae]